MLNVCKYIFTWKNKCWPKYLWQDYFYIQSFYTFNRLISIIQDKILILLAPEALNHTPRLKNMQVLNYNLKVQ